MPCSCLNREGLLAYNSARNWLVRAVRGSELEWVTWHVLRKTTATFLDERLGLAEASAQLGHASEAQTLSAYVARQNKAGFGSVLEGLAARFGPHLLHTLKPVNHKNEPVFNLA